MKRTSILIALALLTVIAVPALSDEAPPGPSFVVNGYITNPSENGIINVNVTVLNQRTLEKWYSFTDGNGFYQFILEIDNEIQDGDDLKVFANKSEFMEIINTTIQIGTQYPSYITLNGTLPLNLSPPGPSFIIQGYIQNEEGQVIQDATVVLRNNDTDMSWSTTSDENGYYKFTLEVGMDVVDGNQIFIEASKLSVLDGEEEILNIETGAPSYIDVNLLLENVEGNNPVTNDEEEEDDNNGTLYLLVLAIVVVVVLIIIALLKKGKSSEGKKTKDDEKMEDLKGNEEKGSKGNEEKGSKDDEEEKEESTDNEEIEFENEVKEEGNEEDLPKEE